MKIISTLILILGFFIANSQSLPIDFESAITTSNFENFDGGTATVIPNPQSSGINTSGNVAQIVRNGGAIWSGSKIKLAANLNFTTKNAISMKVFTTAPIGTIVKFKLEGNGATERDATTTVTNDWETLTWDFSGTASDFDFLVFMFDFGNVGDGSATSTFLFDDIEQFFGGNQIDLPVDFENTNVNYTVTDFGGTESALVADPSNANNKVIKAIKTASAATWAGTTIGTSAGFKTNIPLTLTSSKMNVRVWSPDAGIPVRLKVEDSKDNTHTCETQTNTTVSGDWEVIEFDFSNEASGTAKLSFGLDNGWTYNKASIFFNFDTDGATAGEKTYYFDDVKFGKSTASLKELNAINISVYPNPTSNNWTISGEHTINKLSVFSYNGTLIKELNPDSYTAIVAGNDLESGIYFIQISADLNVSTAKLIKE